MKNLTRLCSHAKDSLAGLPITFVGARQYLKCTKECGKWLCGWPWGPTRRREGDSHRSKHKKGDINGFFKELANSVLIYPNNHAMS